MAGRGQQTFKKRQKEQERKERQQQKFATRLERKKTPSTQQSDDEILAELHSSEDLEDPEQFLPESLR